MVRSWQFDSRRRGFYDSLVIGFDGWENSYNAGDTLREIALHHGTFERLTKFSIFFFSFLFSLSTSAYISLRRIWNDINPDTIRLLLPVFSEITLFFRDAKCSFVYLDLQERRTIYDRITVVISSGCLQTYNSSYFSVLDIGMEIGSWERSNRSIDIDADVDAPESAG